LLIEKTLPLLPGTEERLRTREPNEAVAG
jgi:hypothetical protein